MDDAQYWLSSSAGNVHGLNYNALRSSGVHTPFVNVLFSEKLNLQARDFDMRMEAVSTHKGKRIYSVDTVSIQCRHCVDTVLVSVQTLYEHFRLSKNSSPKKTRKDHYRYFLRVRHTVVMGQTGELIRWSPLTSAFEQRLFANWQHVSTLIVSRHQPQTKYVGKKTLTCYKLLLDRLRPPTHNADESFH